MAQDEKDSIAGHDEALLKSIKPNGNNNADGSASPETITAGDQPLSWSTFKHARDNAPICCSGTWDDLAQLLTTVLQPPKRKDPADAKKAVPAFSGTTFFPGTTRAIEHADQVHLLVFDFDNCIEVPTPGEFHPSGRPKTHKVPIKNPAHPRAVAARLKALGIAAVFYTTWSNSKDLPKFRVVIPLASPVPALLWVEASEWAMVALGFEEWRNSGAIDLGVLHDSARLNFLPCAPDPSSVQAGELDGAAFTIDVGALGTYVIPDRPKPDWLKPRPKRDPKTGDDWFKAYPVEFQTLDLVGLLQDMGVEVGKARPFKEGKKYRCHCLWPVEHTHALDDDCAVVITTFGDWPSFKCLHTSHAELGLREIIDAAGAERVEKFAGAFTPGAQGPGDESILFGAEKWTAEQIRGHVGQLAAFQRANSKRLVELINYWDMFGAVQREELDALLLAAQFQHYGLDLEAISASPAELARPEVQLGLARLQVELPYAYAVLADRLTAKGAKGTKPIGVMNLKRATAAGAALLRKEGIRAARDKDGRAVVAFRPDNLTITVDEIQEAIIQPVGPDPVFNFAGSFVTVRKAQPVTVRELSGGDYPPMSIIHTYTLHSMMERITRAVRLEETDSKGQIKAIPVSTDLVRMLLSRGGGSAPLLTCIIDSPTIRQDGTVLDQEGYDPDTGVLATFNGKTFPAIRESPSLVEAQEALRYLQDEVFDQFPFAEEVDKTVAAAALITGLVRPLVGLAPPFLVSAPMQSSGKTALCEVIVQGAYGRPPAATSWPANDAEMSKFILAALREGQRAIVFDNLRDGSVVNSEAFAAAISSEQFSSRILGVSDTATVPTSVLWLLTGNNIGLARDMPTRVLRLYLDSKEERPDQRSFKRDLVSWVADHRPKIVHAALTIVRAYVVAGRPEVATTATRYPLWDKLVRCPLIYAGGKDIGEKFTNSVLDDPTWAPWVETLEAWHDLFGVEAMRTGDVLEALEAHGPGAARTAAAAFEAEDPKVIRLKNALKDAMSDSKWVKTNRISLGSALAKCENRPLGALKMVRFEDSHSKTNKWSVRPIH